MLAVGGAPIVIWLAVSELVVIVLAVRLLIVVLSIMTLDAMNWILPLVVKNCPEPFVIELVARRFWTNSVPVEIEPPVLSIITLEALNIDTLSAINWPAIVRFVILRSAVLKFVAATVSAYRMPVLIVLAITALMLRYPPAGA